MRGSAHRGRESYWEAAREQGFQQLHCNWMPLGIHLPVKKCLRFRVNLSIFLLPHVHQSLLTLLVTLYKVNLNANINSLININS